MKKKFLLIGILVVTSLLVFQNCDFNPKDEKETNGWNDEPVYYLYSIKESIRPYVYIPDGYEAALANSLSDNDLAVLKFIVNKMKTELQALTPDTNITVEKINNTISMADDIVASSDIETVKTSYFLKYRWYISDYSEKRFWWLRGQKIKLSNLVTKGDKMNLNTILNNDIIPELEKEQEKYNIVYNNIRWIKMEYTIKYFQVFVQVGTIEQVRNLESDGNKCFIVLNE